VIDPINIINPIQTAHQSSLFQSELIPLSIPYTPCLKFFIFGMQISYELYIQFKIDRINDFDKLLKPFTYYIFIGINIRAIL
jgi:hypothetical protein